MIAKRESKRAGSTITKGGDEGVAGQPLSAGLWLVATPIGNLGDITLRAISVLKNADIIACEDTRRTRQLLDLLDIPLAGRPVWSYNDHNAAGRRPQIMAALADGKSVAYASDAGTPLIADPGYRLVQEAREAGHAVDTAPGPSAVIAALTLAGMPTDRFFFAGFLPPRSGARRREAEKLKAIPGTLVLFETAKRLVTTLKDLSETLGADRTAAVVREITKAHQDVQQGSLADLAGHYEETSPRGEIVVVIGPKDDNAANQDAWIAAEEDLRRALETLSVKDSVRAISERHGLARSAVYKRALAISGT